MKKNKKNIVLVLLLVLSCLMGTTAGDVTVVKAGTSAQQKETIFQGNGFTVKYIIESQWNNGYIANVVITNTGEEVIENWELSYSSTDEYTNIWNARVSYHAATIYNIKNAGHNQNIKPGESVSFGFQAAFTDKINVPVSYKILGDRLVVNDKECKICFEIQNQWNTGCIMNTTIYNNSDMNIENWSMEFNSDLSIDNIWRAEIVKHEGSRYFLKNCGYNSVIKPKESETFGMQISFAEGTDVSAPTDVVTYQYQKDKWYMDFDKDWNRSMIKADDVRVQAALKKNQNTIKIGLIDSGVDFSSNIQVVESENFVDEYDDKNPIFEDVSGHGTAVAGILASDATKNEAVFEFDNKYLNQLSKEKIKGVNPYVQIYSAEVLDDSNETTVNRLAEGIEWAIQKDVDILNISCGFPKDSDKLHNVIKKAYNKGILIIAAAGNGGSVQYPAKYDEVMAVGSVKCNAQLSENSAKGKEIEVVAPGDDVTAYGPFGIITNQSGTSMAAPQVTALAALLWQQDKTKSAAFIRQLIDATAHPLGEKEYFGYGLIDCVYALEQYDSYKEKYSETGAAESIAKLADNEGSLLLTDEKEVTAFWRNEEHTKTSKRMSVVKYGANWPDDKNSKVKGMVDHPKFHGYYKSDYVKAYRIMTQVASKMYTKGKFITPENADASTKSLVKNIKKAAKAGFKRYKYTTKEDKSRFIYGMSLHTVADVFAHSTTGIKGKSTQEKKKKSVKKLCKQWKRLKHGPRNPKTGKFYKSKNFADMPECIPKRFNQGAMRVCGAVINESVIKHKAGTKNVFKNIQYYSSVKKAMKIKTKRKKKEYLVKSYGIIRLSKYLNVSKGKLKKTADNASSEKVRKVVDAWK